MCLEVSRPMPRGIQKCLHSYPDVSTEISRCPVFRNSMPSGVQRYPEVSRCV